MSARLAVVAILLSTACGASDLPADEPGARPAVERDASADRGAEADGPSPELEPADPHVPTSYSVPQTPCGELDILRAPSTLPTCPPVSCACGTFAAGSAPEPCVIALNCSVACTLDTSFVQSCTDPSAAPPPTTATPAVPTDEESCTSDRECTTGRCGKWEWQTIGRCTDGKAGSWCTMDDDCESTFCAGAGTAEGACTDATLGSPCYQDGECLEGSCLPEASSPTGSACR